MLFLRLSMTWFALVMWVSASSAENRAFVVGINDYAKWDELKTAVNDARAVDETLRAAKFVVTRVTDATAPLFFERWREFLNSLQPQDLVVFYFGGHGFQLDGTNYLVLKDSPPPDAGETPLLQGSVNFFGLMQDLQAREPAKAIYILDACRVSPVADRTAKAKQGQMRGFALGEEVHGTFVLYSAGPGEEALDYLLDATKEGNSVYARRLLELLKTKELGLNTIATRIRAQVEEDAKTRKHTQVPAYIDGIRGGQYRWDTLEASDKGLGPDGRVTSGTVIRLGGFASWDANCQSQPAPRVSTTSRPRFGRIFTRFESFTAGGAHVGTAACENTTQKGIGVYYAIDQAHADSTAVDTVRLTVKHWAISPSVSVPESFNVDLATKLSRRVTAR